MGAVAAIVLWAPPALAGDYYVYGCSYYGNAAPAFQPHTDAAHLNLANECMQPAPQGGYRTLELNNPGYQPVLNGYGATWTAYAPQGVSIVGAYTPVNTVLVDCTLASDGFTADYFWAGGSQSINYINDCNPNTGYGYADGIYRALTPGSSYFGWGATCEAAPSCVSSSSANAVVGVQGIRLTAEENSGPGLIAIGSNNLWYQGSHYVRGGGWPVSFVAFDPSGVCSTRADVNGQQGVADVTNDPSPDTSSFTQCWLNDQSTGTINTASYPNGNLTLTLWAVNAAGVVSAPTQTLRVDNTPVSLGLSSPNDADPNVWVNHAVVVDAHASAGPSGIGGINCNVDGKSQSYPASGFKLDGTGTHAVSCSAWNNASDVNGTTATSPTQTMTVKIDEQAPAVAFEPQAPSNPTALTIDTSDGQSGVAGGQIEMRPAGGGGWTQLPTQFDGQHLLANFDDAGLNGPYVFQATSCDHAGNCASATETLSLPMRTASRSSVSFQQVGTTTVSKRVRVDGRWKTIRVVESKQQCTRQRIKAGAPRSRRQEVCRQPHEVLKSTEQVPFGRATTIHGLLATAQGVPLTGARVRILTAPANGLSPFSEQTAVTTDSGGAWSATLPAGPSRTVLGVYDGSATVLPASGEAHEVVPAKVRLLKVWPRHVAWGGTVHIVGQLKGGYLPPGGALVRLRIGYGSARTTYGIQEHVTGNGRFSTTYTFGLGDPSIYRTYWFQIASLPMGDYPFSPAASGRSTVVVGGHPSAPRRPRHPPHSKAQRRTRR